ncbi:MAG TPA: primosomal protein N', partial [Rhodocyclaceae bacterium]|nr:primosomal protein N' [Rhodocyclaceae bacterium]
MSSHPNPHAPTILRVALDLPLPRLFDYRCADAQADDVGYRVRVPFGRGDKVGLVVAVLAASDQPADKLKAATEILRDMPRLPPDWIAL